MPTPYAIGSATSVVNTNAIAIPVTTGTAPGDAIIVGASINSTTTTVVSCADSQGNTYVLKTSHSGDKFDGAMFVAIAGPGGNGQTLPLTGGGIDAITVTLSGSTAAAKNGGAVGCSGCLAVDVTPAPAVQTGSSTTPLLASGARPAVRSAGDVGRPRQRGRQHQLGGGLDVAARRHRQRRQPDIRHGRPGRQQPCVRGRDRHAQRERVVGGHARVAQAGADPPARPDRAVLRGW